MVDKTKFIMATTVPTRNNIGAYVEAGLYEEIKGNDYDIKILNCKPTADDREIGQMFENPIEGVTSSPGETTVSSTGGSTDLGDYDIDKYESKKKELSPSSQSDTSTSQLVTSVTTSSPSDRSSIGTDEEEEYIANENQHQFSEEEEEGNTESTDSEE